VGDMGSAKGRNMEKLAGPVWGGSTWIKSERGSMREHHHRLMRGGGGGDQVHEGQ
jgi:hypothetical protein